ncbi:MAG: hypothetical protein ACRCVT_08810 [Leadbetterella sp.]
MKKLSVLLVVLLIISKAYSQKLFVSTATGKDSNTGSHEQPLKSINEAIKRINKDVTATSSEIIVSEGVYIIDETILIKNIKTFSMDNRFKIRAEILPDDENWHPQRMPTLVTAVPLNKDDAGETGNGIQVEISHVVIQGFRFTGSLDYYNKTENQIRRTYPIWRGGKNLDDLYVTQCVFVGNEQVMPLQVGIIANGHGLVVENCVFYQIKNPVVFWRAEGGTSNRNAMRNCLVYGAENSGVWTVETNGDDFDFRNNVIANSNTVWVREKGSSRKYKAINSIFAYNENMAAYGGGATGNPVLTDSNFLILENMKQSGKITLQMNKGERDFLHILKGTLGSNLKAGLFH